MNKMLWFTKGQVKLLEDIKKVTAESNGQIVREAMKVYADSLGIKYDNVDRMKR